MSLPTHSTTLSPFLIGCIGALSPEIIRLYKLRFNPSVKWTWSYLIFSIPLILLGGFMAHILEPTTPYAAFYTGLSTPFIITTLTKDAEQEAKALQRLTQEKNRIENELYELRQSQYLSPNNTPYPQQPHAQTSNASGDTSHHSTLRSSGRTHILKTPTSSLPASSQHSVRGYRPTSSSSPLRPRSSKRKTFQVFLKAL